jgi:hypothetical protein
MRNISFRLVALAAFLSGTAASASSVELTQAEVSNFMESVRKCWNPPSGAGGKVSVKFKLDRTGAVAGTPQTSGEPINGKGAHLLAAAAKRAVLRCQPYALPAEKYESWSEVIVNFATE